jgi:transcriptional regulator with XRE-family HTH domain
MSKQPQTSAVYSRRLKQARQVSGLSQKQLGIQAGIDEFVASARLNRYELGIHQPDFDTAGRLASVLRVPLAYFFADDDRLADMILAFAQLPKRKQDAILRSVHQSDV